MLGLAPESKHGEARGRFPRNHPGAQRCLDSLIADGQQPRPGTHLVSPRRGYVHHGIYVGDGRVVHYSGLVRGFFSGPVEEVSLAQFAQGRSVWSRWTDRARFDGQEVVRRARSRLGENLYRLLRNNCEHFCEWCLHGEPRSYQIERLLCSRRALRMTLGLLVVWGGGSRVGKEANA